MTKPILLASTLLLATLAGCTGGGGDQFFTVPEDADPHQDAYTGDGYTLRVRVTDLDGTPIPGAAVVFFTGGVRSVGSGEISGSADAAPGSASSSGGVFWEASVQDYDLVAGARTGADGMASADLEPGRSIHVAAGDVDGMTTEMLESVSIGSGGGSGTVSLALYPAQRTIVFDAAADSFAGQAGLGDAAYQNVAIPFDGDADRDAGFHHRLETVRIAMTWENLPTQAGDLFVGLAAGDNRPFLEGHDDRDIDAGQKTEHLEAFADDLQGRHADLAQRKAHAAAMTDYAAGGIDGLPLAFEVEATFKGSDIVIR